MTKHPHHDRLIRRELGWPAIPIASLSLLLLSGLLSGCQPADSHVPELWQLPSAAIGNAIGNAVYDSRRNKVGAYVQQHYWRIREEMLGNASPTHTQQAARIAGVSRANYALLLDDLATNTELYFPTQRTMPVALSAAPPDLDTIEPLVIAMMVHSN